MKNVLIKSLKITIICFALVLSSCEKELYEQSIKKNKTSKTEMLRGKEAEKVALRIKKILNSQNSLSSNEFARTISLNIGNISYDEILKIIDTYGKENYTLKIELPEETDLKFANLILQEKDSYTTIKVIEYNMTEQFAQQYKLNKDLTAFTGTIKFTPIFSDDPCPDPELIINVLDVPANNSGGGGAWSGYIPVEGAGTGGAPGGGGTAGIYQYVYVIVVPISDFSETSPTNTNGNNTGASNWIYWNPPVFNRLAITPVNPSEPCAQDTEIGILVPLEECSKNFLNELNDEQQAWMYQQQSNNAPIYNDILYYVAGDENGCSDQANIIAKEIVERMRLDPTITSIKPFIIEKQINDEQLDPCSKNVFQQIKNTTNNDFAKVLAKLGADGSVYNTTMISAVAPSGRPAQTVKNSPFNYTIYISTDYVGKTKLFIAASMLHELVHAYFMSLFDDYYNGNPPNPNAYNDFAILFQKFVDKTYPGSNDVAHHQQMATDYVDAIASALQEYQPGLPQQVYEDLAWGGLEEAPIFSTLFPLGSSERNRIINRYYSESQGNSYGYNSPPVQTPLGQPCN
jgi:hypothetical protein